MALTLRSGLRTRLAAWPYNNAAVVPHVAPPVAWQIPLRPSNDSYGLPLPFSRKAVELLGRNTSSFGSWDSWYHQHSFALAHSLTEGLWCGYYAHFGIQAAYLDPPMTEIRFRVKDGSSISEWDSMEQPSVEIEALNCIDGIDSFNISGTLTVRDRQTVFMGQKQYQNHPTDWDWNCRLTPFGLVGFWGRVYEEESRVSNYGALWLWKKEWTDGKE